MSRFHAYERSFPPRPYHVHVHVHVRNGDSLPLFPPRVLHSSQFTVHGARSTGQRRSCSCSLNPDAGGNGGRPPPAPAPAASWSPAAASGASRGYGGADPRLLAQRTEPHEGRRNAPVRAALSSSVMTDPSHPSWFSSAASSESTDRSAEVSGFLVCGFWMLVAGCWQLLVTATDFSCWLDAGGRLRSDPDPALLRSLWRVAGARCCLFQWLLVPDCHPVGRRCVGGHQGGGFCARV